MMEQVNSRPVERDRQAGPVAQGPVAQALRELVRSQRRQPAEEQLQMVESQHRRTLVFARLLFLAAMSMGSASGVLVESYSGATSPDSSASPASPTTQVV